MLLCNFNVNNLFVRYKFGKTFPGDQGGKSAVAGTASSNTGYLPLYQKGAFEIFNAEQRKLAALAITQGNTVQPDVVCVQEVESLIALREFNDRFLGGAYPYVVVLDSRDLRQIDVGILSKYPIDSITTHVDDKAADKYIFSRDCLEVRVRVKKTTPVTLFINHFKSKLAMGANEEAKAKERASANLKRKLQADTVVKLLKERFPGPEFKSGYFAVLGDLNDTPLAPQLSGLCVKAGLVDALATLAPEERWTHYWKAKNSVSQLDHVLLSPALSGKLKKDGIYIERRGIGFRSESKKVDGGYLPKQVKVEAMEDDPNPEIIDFQYERFELVSSSNVASDHCAVFLDFKL
ncbi:Metal-dependent hydrolase, endonuclease/exonuclease/phosphatase family [Polaromonas sp. YR568]|uniref:endonuclease/exonuclease/phosphatase family protein n=1 Tax=Polaromonas sp. YR568 TaxID=1855301 RepID=UPI0008F34B86|nr:endonuclease/exonuclease/phosphatase family protein [Polaromonas sp. YR568]SFV03385.1 Metal-dependent hydrolase, endonuclease/exonuclease/phosphatase family [Polaromonas sp. YR568]